MQDLLAEDEEENPQKTGENIIIIKEMENLTKLDQQCVVVELKPTATHPDKSFEC